ncbi:unnamed protein product [Mytilus coruscus]|uniref:Uncharacterized protein n=1 Tax=Mytilus coruscus TaxID=42192 RepID=A0A6J8DJ93_MYTCO|nr:unnamed protein product [Mytilus coruscus]
MEEPSEDVATGYRIGQEEERPSTCVVLTWKTEKSSIRNNTRGSESYTAFDKFHRESSIKMCDYIIEVEQKYNKCKKYDMALPDAILAFKLLDNAGLGQSDRHLALTACSDLKFDTMKAALNRLFASKSQSDNDIVTVKEESAFVDTFDTENEEIKSKESHTSFKFGDGQTVYSYQSVKLPAAIGSLNCYIETEVVDCEIPLLLSKDSLKRAQTVLDLHNDKVTMFGKPVDVHFTSNGHYCINIKERRNGQKNTAVSEEETLKVDSGFSKKRKRDIISKLHKQFGHASSEKLLSLLNSAGSVDSNTKAIVNDVCSKCIVCFKFQCPKQKP